MSTLNKTILAAFVAGDREAAAIEAVKAEIGRMSESKFISLAQEIASKHYSVPLITKSTGKVVFDSSAERYETARKRVQRLVTALFPKEAAADVEIPEELLAAAAKLVKLANEYEGARSLASKALAASFAK
jgi:hypothetical protein